MNFKTKSKADNLPDNLKYFTGGGEMGSLMRSYNWSSHPLGDPSLWPVSLKNSIQLILNSAFPMFLWWSKDLYMFHNDPYIPALGEKHPNALGASAKLMWAEIWDSLWEQLGGNIDSILKEGRHFYAEDLPLFLKRKGYMEETFWTFSYSPAFNDDGSVGGMFCSCYESTKKVLGQRRLNTLKDIAGVTSSSNSLPEVKARISQVLKSDLEDIPFAFYYSLEDHSSRASLVMRIHEFETKFIPQFVEIGNEGEQSLWPFYQILRDHKSIIIEDFSKKYFSFDSVQGDIVNRAVIIPVFKSGQEQVNGFFVAGISPNLEFDEDYKSYLHLLIGQINLAITNFELYEKEKEFFIKTDRERKKLFKVLMEAPVPVSILRGPDHVFDLVNTLYQKLFGKRQLEGKPFRQALPELINQGVYELLDHVYKTGETYIGQELKFDLFPDTDVPIEEMYFTFIMEALRDDNNEIKGIIILCYEVTPQVKAKQNLKKYNAALSSKNKELLKVNADLDNFIYTASHDLKAPISNLEGLFNSLIDSLPINENINEIKPLIKKSFERFKNTIQDLTEISKVQRGTEEEVELVSLSELLDEVKDGMRDQINNSNGKITSQFNVPELRFSKKNLRSILYNLISNGIKYSRPGIPPSIHVSTNLDNDYILMVVADNGLGIAHEHIDKIFQMFKRFHVNVEGTGIGLYIVKRIIENEGGKIEVESEPGKGSKFKLYFPLRTS